MPNDFFDDRKVKSNDIVNGLARKDIYDSKGVLLVKEGARISEAHFKRMREEGLIHDDDKKNERSQRNQGINYVNPNSVHGRLEMVISAYSRLQKKFTEEPKPEDKSELRKIVIELIDLCEENIFQVLGELHIAEISNYNHIKPLYIASSLIELIKRYNLYKKSTVVDDKKQYSLIDAALLYNIGLIQLQKNIADHKDTLSPLEKQQLRKSYPAKTLSTLTKLGITNPDTIEAVKNHNVAVSNPSFEALLLRTPFIYSGIAMPLVGYKSAGNMINPCREFAQMFAERKLDPVLGGLFLKINGLAPVGSILIFDSREKAMVIEGPGAENISSSKMRFLTNKSGLQLHRPGDTFYLHKTSLVQHGLADHHAFAWSKFAPFTMWER